METVTIRKNELTQIVTKNREEHRAIFLEAQKKYREVVIGLLDEELRLAREGRPFNLQRITRVVTPEDHTAAYDRALKMLQLEVAETVVLHEAEFANLVLDEWGWSRRWATSNLSYSTSPKLQALAQDE